VKADDDAGGAVRRVTLRTRRDPADERTAVPSQSDIGSDSELDKRQRRPSEFGPGCVDVGAGADLLRRAASLVAHIAGKLDGAVKERARALLDTVGLGDRRDRLPSLSGGSTCCTAVSDGNRLDD